jgi:hypothetical protein
VSLDWASALRPQVDPTGLGDRVEIRRSDTALQVRDEVILPGLTEDHPVHGQSAAQVHDRG